MGEEVKVISIILKKLATDISSGEASPAPLLKKQAGFLSQWEILRERLRSAACISVVAA